MDEQGTEGPHRDKKLPFRSDLEEYLESNELDREDCCVVGSVCLSVRDLRDHGDVDVCVAPHLRHDLGQPDAPLEIASNKYEHIGISDDSIIYDDKYHDLVDDIKIVRPEIEYSHKQYRRWDKDLTDIKLLEQYRDSTDDWNGELVIEDYRPDLAHIVQRGTVSLRRDGILRTFEHGIELFRRHGPFNRRSQNDYETKPVSVPARALQSYREAGLRKTIARGIRLMQLSDPTGLLQRYSKPRHKIKLGTLAENELNLKYPTADFLNAQYVEDEFARFDVILYLLAIESYRDGCTDWLNLYEKFANVGDAPSVEKFTDVVDGYFESINPPAVPIGYNSSVDDPILTACALYECPNEVEVIVASSFSSRKAYPLKWFENQGFAESNLLQLQSSFSTLLNNVGGLFEVIIWPPAQAYFDEIITTMEEEERLHSCTRKSFDSDTFSDFVREIYGTQSEVRWDYIDRKIDSISRDPSEILAIQLEIPHPRIRE